MKQTLVPGPKRTSQSVAAPVGTLTARRVLWLGCWAGLLVGPILPRAVAQSPVTQPRSDSPVSPIVEAVGAQPGEHILKLGVNRSKVIEAAKPIKRVALTNTEVASFVTLSETQVLIQGRQVGVTHLLLTDQDDQVTAIDVRVAADVSQLKEILHQLYPKLDISVVPIGNAVVLKGEVDRAETIAEINQVAMRFGRIVNHLELVGTQQVLLKVQIGELLSTRMRELGVDWWYKKYDPDTGYAKFIVSRNAGTGTINIGHPDILSVGGQDVSYPIATPDMRFVVSEAIVPTASSNLYFGLEQKRIQAFLRALQENSLYKLVAEPNLVAVSGQAASFQVGGEQPYPVQTQDGIQVEWKNFGTQLRFTPTVIRGNRVRLKVEPENSELDFSRGVTVGTFIVPGLTTRRFQTEVEMEAGQTLAIAGLMRRSSTTSSSGVPLLSDMPVLGALWRQVSARVETYELLVLITPELVEPMAAHQVPAPPGDELREPNDLELYLFGILACPRGERPRRPRPRPLPRSPKDLPMFIGPTGPETR